MVIKRTMEIKTPVPNGSNGGNLGLRKGGNGGGLRNERNKG